MRSDLVGCLRRERERRVDQRTTNSSYLPGHDVRGAETLLEDVGHSPEDPVPCGVSVVSLKVLKWSTSIIKSVSGELLRLERRTS